MLEIDPAHEGVRQALRSASRHIVDLCDKPRPWYDFGTNRFAGPYLGSRKVGGDGLNFVEHLRLVYLARLGLCAGGDDRLKDFITAYAKEWARQLVSGSIPLAYLDEDLSLMGGKPSSRWKTFEKIFYRIVGAAPRVLDEQGRAELHIANGSPDLFLDLFEETQNRLFLDAAERILRPLLSQVTSPYAHPLGHLLWRIYHHGRLPELPQVLAKAISRPPDLIGKDLDLDPAVDWKCPSLSEFRGKVGMRKDMPALQITNSVGSFIPLPPSPGTLGLCYRLTQDEEYLTAGLLLAKAAFLEARRRFPDGARHGCGSRTVSAACIGHGRNWGSGYVSSILRAVPPK